jgi:uncharacterized small protein (DUF1192 family)
MPEQKEVFSVADLAERWGVSQSKVHKMITSGELRPANKPSPVARKVPRYDFLAAEVERVEREAKARVNNGKILAQAS